MSRIIAPPSAPSSHNGRIGETYNIGGNSERANIDVVTTICDLVDQMRPAPALAPRRNLITYVADRPGHDRRYAIDASKLSRELGWKPNEQFESGLRKTVRWYLDHASWVDSVRTGAYREWIEKNYSERSRTMKGIVLAGGSGTRLYPVTHVVSKQLLPVYNKPMIYYPLSTLMLAGLREILLISTPQDTARFADLLGDGSRWGIEIQYAVQPSPDGLAQAFLIGREFIGDSTSRPGSRRQHLLRPGILAAAPGRRPAYPGSHRLRLSRSRTRERYGVVEFDPAGRAISLEEKPKKPKSRFAVTGLYFYDNQVAEIASSLKPSPRGELEITDLNRCYLKAGTLSVEIMSRGMAWLDTGTHDSLLEAAIFVHTIERRQGLNIACPEEIAFRLGFISAAQLETLAQPIAKSGYGQYLLSLLREHHFAPKSE